MLQKDLSKYGSDNSVYLDAACNNCRNRKFFPGGSYFGLDYDSANLEKSVDNHDVTGLVQADLANCSLPLGSVDICVTTETLEHMKDDDRLAAVKNLMSTVRTGGHYFLNSHSSAVTDRIVAHGKTQFQIVEVYCYRNKISKRFESMIAKSGRIDVAEPKVYTLFKRVIAAFLYMIELATPNFTRLNTASYIRCMGKKSGSASEDFQSYFTDKRIISL